MIDDAAARDDLLDRAWGLLCNVSEGDWTKQAEEWQEAILMFRSLYHEYLGVSKDSGHHA